MSDPKKGIDLAAAREALKGLPARRLDGDWFAVDAQGHAAFFAGNERGAIPEDADRERVTEALEAIARAASIRHAVAVDLVDPDAYRGLADRSQEPVFDPPCSSRGRPLHERPVEGYPLLVVGIDPAIRTAGTTWEGREVGAREGFAIVFPVIGPDTWDELHGTDVCAGCRVLDDPADVRPRAPEALAAAGLYVYAHVDDDPTQPYRRIVGPTIAADLVDLEPLVQLVASRVRLPLSFENAASLQPADFVRCTG